ncbi:MAG: hypothetical protein KC561_06280, partial [Myxococcales bacterium]|nr:hypothetical protein [Myxococcales bacterium]
PNTPVDDIVFLTEPQDGAISAGVSWDYRAIASDPSGGTLSFGLSGGTSGTLTLDELSKGRVDIFYEPAWPDGYPDDVLIGIDATPSEGQTTSQSLTFAVDYPDDDQDGMADPWEEEHEVDDPQDDPDHDNLSNLQEFQGGTDPNESDVSGPDPEPQDMGFADLGSDLGEDTGTPGSDATEDEPIIRGRDTSQSDTSNQSPQDELGVLVNQGCGCSSAATHWDFSPFAVLAIFAVANRRRRRTRT